MPYHIIGPVIANIYMYHLLIFRLHSRDSVTPEVVETTEVLTSLTNLSNMISREPGLSQKT